MKISTIEKAKFKKLQRRLKTDLKSTIGILELLWRATCNNAPAGDIGKLDNEMIAIECDWEGDPDALIDALLESGWLDESDTYRLIVHDWEAHAPNFIKGNLRRHGKKFAKNGDSTIAASPEQPAKATEEATIATSPEQPAIAPYHLVQSSLVKSSPVKQSQAKPKPPPPPPSSEEEVVEEEEEVFGNLWLEIFDELRSLGMSDLSCVYEAYRKGIDPTDIWKLIEYYRSRPTSWGIGALSFRIRQARPGDDPTHGWPEPKPDPHRKPKPSLEVFRSRVIANRKQLGKPIPTDEQVKQVYEEKHGSEPVQNVGDRLPVQASRFAN